MKVSVHLVSLPWPPVTQPSVALGCLKAYINKYFNGNIKCHSYSAYVEVLVNSLGTSFIEFTDPLHFWLPAETISQVAYFEEFKKNELDKVHRRDFIKQIKAELKLFSISVADKLRSSLKNYVDNRIVPNLNKDGVNIVGLSMCMLQCYSSAFVGKYLKENYPEYNFVFLFGGSSADSVNVAKVFADEEIPGFFVIGEGEAKLASIIEIILKSDSWSKVAEEQISEIVPGVLPISKRLLQYERNKSFYKTQLDLGSLPNPDYQEYFDTLKKICADGDAYDEFMKMVRIPLEGTRGCFGRCDFCNNDKVWEGFRCFSQERITENALSYTSKYRCNNIIFVDNVCNTWAEKFADDLIARKRSIVYSMELRAKNGETFWTKLALSGLGCVQIGVEALSPPLLKAIGKGTTVVQNVITQKYLKELKIKSCSNIMANHPKSTIEDVKYTKYVLEHLPHLDQFYITYFGLVQGSPIYTQLRDTERQKLKLRVSISCKGKYKELYISEAFKFPKNLLSPKVKKAWGDFADWYEKRKKNLDKEPERLDIIECSDDILWIRKVSNDKQKDFKFNEKYAKVYEICHRGLSCKQICDQLNYSKSEIMEILNEFLKKKFMVDIEGIFISLALRSRDALIQDFYQLN